MVKVALLIGVSDYESGLNPLPGAVKDVEAMRRVLAHPEMGGFAEVDITVLKNPQRQEMEEAIYRLFANRQKDDLLLFYFSGHGIKDDSGKLYLSTRFTRKENGRLVKPSAVAANFLHESINESKSQRQVLILDCCFSGAIAQGMSVKDDDSVNVQEQLGGKGRAILTASTSTQYAFEQQSSELSVYTQYLVEGIEKGAADQDGDGWISVSELHDYASIKVTEAAPAMTPKFYPVEDGSRILLAKSPKDDPKVKYRKEVERRINRGKFSIPARRLLNSLRLELKLDLEDAAAIEAEVQQPYQEYQRKLEEYEATLVEAIEAESTLSESALKDLRDYQQYLGLRDEDVAPIEERIVGEQETEYQNKPLLLLAPKEADYQKQQVERLAKPSGLSILKPPIPSGTILQDRYHLIRVLGQGGFGRTYLAEDQGRFNEPCAIKELSSPETRAYELEKSKELFQREAEYLYKINHPQVLEFRANFEQNGRLFLVQDYVEGKTYRELLNERKAQTYLQSNNPKQNIPVPDTGVFSAAEVRQLMLQLLPILDHIHSKGIIHRDITPDNIIRRNSDGLPVLIDFGVVKELVALFHSPAASAPLTTIWKVGYAPSEQIQIGRAYPSSDLYSLAATAVVLLTGKEPQQLFDENQLSWSWRRWVNVSDQFAHVLNRMLSYRPSDRYQTAMEVLQALQSA